MDSPDLRLPRRRRTSLDIGEPLDTGEHIQPALRAGDRLRDGPRPRGRARDRDRSTRRDVWGGGGHRGARLALRDYRFTMPDVVADNTSAGRFVVGTPVPAAGIDLRLVGVVLEQTARSWPRRRGPHPSATRRLPSPGWCARSPPRRGAPRRRRDPLRRPHRRRPGRAGDVVVATIDRLGSWSSRVGDVRSRSARQRAGNAGRSPTGIAGTRSRRRPDGRHRRACPHAADPLSRAWSATGHGLSRALVRLRSRDWRLPHRPRQRPPLHPVVEEDGMLYAEVTVEPQLSWSERLRAHATSHERGAS